MTLARGGNLNEFFFSLFLSHNVIERLINADETRTNEIIKNCQLMEFYWNFTGSEQRNSTGMSLTLKYFRGLFQVFFFARDCSRKPPELKSHKVPSTSPFSHLYRVSTKPKTQTEIHFKLILLSAATWIEFMMENLPWQLICHQTLNEQPNEGLVTFCIELEVFRNVIYAQVDSAKVEWMNKEILVCHILQLKLFVCGDFFTSSFRRRRLHHRLNQI